MLCLMVCLLFPSAVLSKQVELDAETDSVSFMNRKTGEVVAYIDAVSLLASQKEAADLKKEVAELKTAQSFFLEVARSLPCHSSCASNACEGPLPRQCCVGSAIAKDGECVCPAGELRLWKLCSHFVCI